MASLQGLEVTSREVGEPAKPPAGLRRRTIWGFASSMCLVGAFFLTLSPILKSMAVELGALPHQLGYPGGAYSLGLGLTALACSSFQDTLPRRWLAVLGMVCHIAGALMVSLAGCWTAAVLGYAVCGIGVGVFQPAVYAHVVANAPEASRARLLGRVNMGWGASTLLGVPLSAWISEHLGWRIVALLAIGAWLVVAALIVDLLVSPQPRRQHQGRVHWTMDVLGELHCSRVTWLFLVTVLVFVGFYGVYSFLGLALIEQGHLKEGGVGFFVFWYGLGFVVGSQRAETIDRIGDRKALILSVLGLGIVLLVLPFTLGSKPMLGGAMTAWGLLQVTAFTSITSIAGTMCPQHRGRSLSLKSSSVMLGASLGTFTMGFVMARFGYSTVTTVCGLITILAALLARTLLWRARGPTRFD